MNRDAIVIKQIRQLILRNLDLVYPSGLTVTTDRKLALTREEFDFLTWDHPLVTGAMDLYLGSGKGNAAFACGSTDAEPALFLELLLVLEATALSYPEMQAFLPPTPLRVVVDTQLQDAEALLPEDGVSTFIEGSAARFNQLVPALADHLPRMVAAGRGLARERAQATITAALRQAEAAMHKTVDRLTALSRLNATAIDERDRDAAKREWESLLTQISKARLRLDALRLVVKGAAG